MKKLNELINCKYDMDITGIATNSNLVKKGDLFVCIHGFYCDRHDYIEEAIRKGANAIVVDKDISITYPTIKVKDTNKALLEICDKFYDHPLDKMKTIGITGTDGKTTTATMIWQLLNHFYLTGYIGTNGIYLPNNKYKTANTTPIPEVLYKSLHDMNKQQVKYVSMEVSSEALLHERVEKIPFDIAILTNITEDHLNIHKSIAEYVKSKGKLFSLVKKDGICILNRDDDHYNDIIKYCKGKKIYTYGEHQDSDFLISNIKEKDNTAFTITYNDKSYNVKSNYIGKYNVWNLTAAIITVYLIGCDINKLINLIPTMTAIPGRTELLDYGQEYQILLDYAHTPNSILNILSMVNSWKKGKIITVTGAAGGREKKKRPIIGQIVLTKSNEVIFTMDDPRYEKVDDIIDEMIGEYKGNNYMRIINRKQAIATALDMARKTDVVLILGKGRDNYMAIGKERIPYSDVQCIEEYMKKKN